MKIAAVTVKTTLSAPNSSKKTPISGPVECCFLQGKNSKQTGRSAAAENQNCCIKKRSTTWTNL
jgi:hypothetical protein